MERKSHDLQKLQQISYLSTSIFTMSLNQNVYRHRFHCLSLELPANGVFTWNIAIIYYSSCVRMLDGMCVMVTALVDLEPAQLLLFVQSFGIPVVSMSRLLHCLDIAVEQDTEAMEGAVVDKGYMAQLIEVQRMRGATGGTKFYELLLEGHSAPSRTGW